MTTLQQDTRKIIRHPAVMHPAYLAEPYDGIGQFALVVFGRASTSAGLKVRVASGDFNSHRRFPAGAPVHVFSFRGKLEVFLGNRHHTAGGSG